MSERERLTRSIRALELEMGLREWDSQDRAEARSRLLAQIRYIDPADIDAYIEQERVRLTSSAGAE